MNSIVFNLFLGVSLLVVGYLAAPLVINEQTSPSSYLLSNEHVTSSSMDDMETYSSTVDVSETIFLVNALQSNFSLHYMTQSHMFHKR